MILSIAGELWRAAFWNLISKYLQASANNTWSDTTRVNLENVFLCGLAEKQLDSCLLTKHYHWLTSSESKFSLCLYAFPLDLPCVCSSLVCLSMCVCSGRGVSHTDTWLTRTPAIQNPITSKIGSPALVARASPEISAIQVVHDSQSLSSVVLSVCLSLVNSSCFCKRHVPACSRKPPVATFISTALACSPAAFPSPAVLQPVPTILPHAHLTAHCLHRPPWSPD